jgi:hypothetical protein
MNAFSSIFKSMSEKDSLVRLKYGVVEAIDPATNLASVKYSKIPGDYVRNAWIQGVFQNTGDQSASDANQRFMAWGIFGLVSVKSMVLTFEIGGQIPFILCAVPPRLGYGKWQDENKVKMNRVPIAAADQRAEDTDRGISDDLLKWGEILMRSSGLGDVYIDYKGNIVLDTSAQVTIRIGTRDANNKITSPDTEVSFGKILTTGGAEKTYSSKKVKVEIIYKNAFIRILDDGQVNVNGNLTVDV